MTTLSGALIILVIGICVYFTGLSNQFVGDDYSQIVNSPKVHSIANVGSFFNGGTFVNQIAGGHLTGVYYRPLMIVTYSLLYTLFGPNPFAFHLLQLGLCIACAILVFLVLRYFIRPSLSLALALIFLVHPIDSQAVYSIASLQEPLFFLLGILAFWTLLRFQGKSDRYLLLTAVLLLLSVLSKETGVLFVAISLSYLLFFNHKRFSRLLGMCLAMLVLYSALKIHAVGLATNPRIAPIDNLSIWIRLLNIPTMIAFYIQKFIFPLQLAHIYDWAYSAITFDHFFLPLVVDVLFGALVALGWLYLKKSNRAKALLLYKFFSLWFVLGLLICMQLVPLDSTVSETWFYFPIVGLLGMVGVLLEAIPVRLPRLAVIAAVALIIGLLGWRSALRGPDWSNVYKLAFADSAVSPSDYDAKTIIANYLEHEGKFAEAKSEADESLAIYPSWTGYDALGLALLGLRDFPGAHQAFSNGMKISSNEVNEVLVGHMGELTLFYGNENANKSFLTQAVREYPQNTYLWFYLAMENYNNGNTLAAQTDISQSVKYSNLYRPEYVYIMNDRKFTLDIDIRPPLNLSD